MTTIITNIDLNRKTIITDRANADQYAPISYPSSTELHPLIAVNFEGDKQIGGMAISTAYAEKIIAAAAKQNWLIENA